MVHVLVVAYFGVVLLANFESEQFEMELQRLEELRYGLKGA
jgi:hypothetical protein